MKQLRLEADIDRMKVSEATKELIDFVLAHQEEDKILNRKEEPGLLACLNCAGDAGQ